MSRTLKIKICRKLREEKGWKQENAKSFKVSDVDNDVHHILVDCC